GRGVTNMYIHNSGSSEEQKDFVGAQNFATLPLPIGPAKKRTSFYFSETLTAFRNGKNREGAWRFMAWLMDDEPNFMYCKTLGLPRSFSCRRAWERMTGYLYLVPVAIALGGTIVVPILKAMHMSLFNYVLIKPQEYGFVGLGNYTRLLRDETFWLTLWNSFVW